MTSTFRAMLGSSLVAAAIAIAPMAANAQTTSAMTATPKVAKSTSKATKSASPAATKSASSTAKAAEKTESKTTKAVEKAADAPKKEAKTVKTEAKAVKAADIVTCTDGSMSKGGQGACSSHGGIKAAALPTKAVVNKAAASPSAAPKAVVKANAKSAVAVTDASNSVAAGAIAKCKDGTYSHARNRTGACSGHGGVASWM